MTTDQLSRKIDTDNRRMWAQLNAEEYDRITALLTPHITYIDVIPGTIRVHDDPVYDPFSQIK